MLSPILMVEVDVFWSWAFGAIFAGAASGALAKSENRVNKFGYYNALFLALIFGPSGAYLLSRFPGWESMWLLHRDSCFEHPMLPTVFAFTNVFLGLVSFELSHRAIRRGDDLAAHTHWVWAYAAFFAILGMGYARFLYAGSIPEWTAGVAYPYLAFFSSEVFYSLLVMAVFLLPALYIPAICWFSQSYPTAKDQKRFTSHVLRETGKAVGVITIGYVLYTSLVLDSASRARLVDGPFLHFAPLVGFYVALLVAYFPLVVAPFALINTEKIANSSWAQCSCLSLDSPAETIKSSKSNSARRVSPAVVDATVDDSPVVKPSPPRRRASSSASSSSKKKSHSTPKSSTKKRSTRQ